MKTILLWPDELLDKLLANTDADGDCLIWRGSKNSQGYAGYRWPRGWFREGWCLTEKVSVHKAVYMLMNKNMGVPPTLDIKHSCDRSSCVNPAHLSVGTRAENMQECVQRGRQISGLGRHGSHVNAKLTEDQVREIRSSFELGQTKASLARSYDVDFKTIDAIVSNRTWIGI